MFLFKKRNIPVPVEPQPTPYTKASLLSKITYSWADPLFKTGYSRPLQDNDLYLLDPSFKVKVLIEKYLRKWENITNKSKKQTEILKIFFKIYGLKWIFAGVMMFISDCCNIVSPIILELLLNYITNESQEVTYKGWIFAFSLFLLKLCATLCMNIYNKTVSEIGLCLRTTIIGIVYRKMFKLSQNAKMKFSDGHIINIVSSDSNRIEEICEFLHYFWSGPLQLIIILILLIRALSYWALIGFSIIVILIPIQGVIMAWLTDLREQIVVFTDERIKKTQEIISSMRVIKFFGWESSFLNIINKLRAKELSRIKKSYLLFVSIDSIIEIIPVIATSLTFICYALAGNELTAAKVFSTLAFFEMLSLPLGMIPMILSDLADAVVSLKRINEVINGEELDELLNVDPNAEYAIYVKDGNFCWETSNEPDNDNDNNNSGDENSEEDITDSYMNYDSSDKLNNIENDSKVETSLFKIKNINLQIPKKSLTAIIGTVGSGKSSLVNALTGEMKRESGEVIFGGSISYCPQQAWIQNATVKDNILFGKEYDAEKYNKAIESCALISDLKTFKNGDMTEIGERGINLSGGQKQRINLARAVYYDSDIVLLDDPLSAVDAHVSRFLFDNCIMGVLKDKTRILITHQLHYLPNVDYIIYMNKGEILEQGTYTELMDNNGEFTKLMQNYGCIDEKNNDDHRENNKDKNKNDYSNKKNKDNKLLKLKSMGNDDSDDKNDTEIKNNIDENNIDREIEEEENEGLMVNEERNTGSIKFSVYKFYIVASGGLKCFIFILASLLLAQLVKLLNDMWLVFWTDKKFDLSIINYVLIYLSCSILEGVTKIIFGVVIVLVGMVAAGKIHRDAIARVMSAPILFFDTTPLGRIINRFSKDQDSVDNVLIESIQAFLTCFASAISSLILIIYATPIFIVALIPLLIIYYLIQEYYRNSSREIKRLDSLARSVLYANFTETMNGLSTIRAYHEQERFIKNNNKFIDNNNRPNILQIAAQRWFDLRLEIIGALIVLFAAVSGLLLKKTISPALLGLSLSYSLNITGILNWAVHNFSETEVNMNAAERLSHYANDIEIENPAGLDAPKQWPQNGKIEIKNLTMKYAPNLPPVLNKISLDIQAGEKIGIVGRTGAGKSSIVMTLLRLVEPEIGSTIKIDDISITDIKLNDLRRRIAIVPQDPILFSGTIRFNMDPFNEYTDQEIWNALENAGLKTMISELENKLEFEVCSNGENFSVGQRQLLCLARAMIRHSRVLIMDEASASVDIETDMIIQNALRSEFDNVTVITIAHRLNTIIDYDKILVLSQGNILEYDKSINLLFEQDKNGSFIPTNKTEFSKLVDETGPVNAELLRNTVLSS